MMAWIAFCNMLRAAARDPVWAIVTLIMSPLRVGLLAKKIGFIVGGIFHTALTYGGALITTIALFRMLTNPVIQHFGNQQS